MKASDLMIGDLVKYDNKVCKVCTTEAQMLLLSFDGGERLTREDKVEPIPITPKILKKNGFRYVERDEEITHFYQGEPQFCKDMTLHIGTNNRGDYWINTYSNTIYGLRFVYELQHALKLCGIDKTIEL